MKEINNSRQIRKEYGAGRWIFEAFRAGKWKLTKKMHTSGAFVPSTSSSISILESTFAFDIPELYSKECPSKQLGIPPKTTLLCKSGSYDFIFRSRGAEVRRVRSRWPRSVPTIIPEARTVMHTSISILRAIHAVQMRYYVGNPLREQRFVI